MFWVQASFRVSYPNYIISRIKCIYYIGKKRVSNSHFESKPDACYNLYPNPYYNELCYKEVQMYVRRYNTAIHAASTYFAIIQIENVDRTHKVSLALHTEQTTNCQNSISRWGLWRVRDRKFSMTGVRLSA